ERKKADWCRNAERRAGEQEREDSADHRHGDNRYAQEGIGQRGEIDVQQYANEQDSQGDNHPEALDRVLEVAEFADPFQAIPRRQRHVFRNLSLRLEHRAAQIPPANAEFDGNIALLLFAVDERRATHQVDARDLAEGYLRDLVSDRILDRDRQTTDRLYVLSIFWREPNDQREVPIASLLIEIARGLPADGGLNRRIDVTGRQPITCGGLAVDIDTQGRLAERGEDCEIGYTAYLAHRGFDLVRGLRQHDDVVADQLDRVLAFDAGYSFLDIVLDVLREVEVDAWKLRLQSFVDLLDELVLGHAPAPFLCRLERGKKFSVEEAGSIGAVVGPSLLGYDRLDFRKIPDHQPHAVDEVIALLERDR